MQIENKAAYIPSVGGNIEGGSFATLLQPGQLGMFTTVNQGTDAAPIWVTYQLVKLKTGVTFAVGEILYWDDFDDKIVTNVQAGNNVAGFIPAGGAQATAPTATYTATQYAFIVTEGLRCVKLVDSPTVAADAVGKALVPHATAGRVDCVTTAVMNMTVGRTRSTQDGTTKLALAMVSVQGN